MRICLRSVLAISVLIVPVTAHTQTKSAAPTNPLCAPLVIQIDEIEKDMAVRDVEGLTDTSAPRAQLRETQTTNAQLQAQFALELMRVRSCPLPSHAPMSYNYFAAALACKNEEMKGVKGSPACNRDNWTPRIKG